MRKTPYILVIIAFLANTFGPFPSVQAQEFRLPAPGVRVGLSPDFSPLILKGIKIHPDNPFRFDFILDQGDSSFSSPEATKLIKYFLASLTIPEKDLWVNLSPYEKSRIIPQSFGQTEMGRDLLAEDYMLKQITASLIYPEGETGRKFWKRIYEEAAKKFGTTNIPVNTFNKVWIIPEKAVVYENAKAGTAYVVEAKLKVMLEQDYLSMSKHSVQGPTPDINKLGSDIVREIVIPELTKEVNEDKNFSQLRQVYNSLILAAWYKKKIKDSILEQIYADKNKIKGLSFLNASIGDPEHIYQQYLQAFKKGVYNYIKEEPDPMTRELIPRKYFSGGVDFAMGNDSTAMKGIDRAMTITQAVSAVGAIFNALIPGRLVEVEGKFETSENPLVFSPVNVPEGYEPIGGKNNPQLAARLQKTTGLTTALLGHGVYSPLQDNGLTLEFMDIISAYIKKLDSGTIKNNVFKVLEIGSGSGLGSMTAFHQAKQRGFQVKIDAIDINDESVENTRNNFDLLKNEIIDKDSIHIFKVPGDGQLKSLSDQYDLILFYAPDAVPKEELGTANVAVRMDRNIFKTILQVIADRLLAKKGVAIIGIQRNVMKALAPESLKWEPSGASEAGVYLRGQEESRAFFKIFFEKDQAMGGSTPADTGANGTRYLHNFNFGRVFLRFIMNKRKNEDSGARDNVFSRTTDLMLLNFILEAIGLTPSKARGIGFDRLTMLWNQYWRIGDALLDNYGKLFSIDELEAMLENSGDKFPVIPNKNLAEKGISDEKLKNLYVKTVSQEDHRNRAEILAEFNRKADDLIAQMPLTSAQKSGIKEAFVANSRLFFKSYILERKYGLYPTVDQMTEIFAAKDSFAPLIDLREIFSAHTDAREISQFKTMFLNTCIYSQVIDDYLDMEADYRVQPNIILSIAKHHYPKEFKMLEGFLKDRKFSVNLKELEALIKIMPNTNREVFSFEYQYFKRIFGAKPITLSLMTSYGILRLIGDRLHPQLTQVNADSAQLAEDQAHSNAQAEAFISESLRKIWQQNNYSDIKVEAQFYDTVTSELLQGDQHQFIISFKDKNSAQFFTNVRLNKNAITSMVIHYPRATTKLFDGNYMMKSLLLAINRFVKKETGNNVELFATPIVFDGASRFFEDFFHKYGASAQIATNGLIEVVQAHLNSDFWENLSEDSVRLPGQKTDQAMNVHQWKEKDVVTDNKDKTVWTIDGFPKRRGEGGIENMVSLRKGGTLRVLSFAALSAGYSLRRLAVTSFKKSTDRGTFEWYIDDIEKQVSFLRSKARINPDDFIFSERIIDGLKHIDKYMHQPGLSSQKMKTIFQILIKVIFTCDVGRSVDDGNVAIGTEEGAYNLAKSMFGDLLISDTSYMIHNDRSDINMQIADVLKELAIKNLNIKDKRLDFGIPLIVKQFSNMEQIINLQEKKGDIELRLQTFKPRTGRSLISLSVESQYLTDLRLGKFGFSSGHTHGFTVPLEASESDTGAAEELGMEKNFILAVDRETHTLQLAYYDHKAHDWMYIRDASKAGQKLIQEKLIEFGVLKDRAMAGEKENTGGIDFTANKTPLEIQNAGAGIKFHLDPAMLEQLRNAPGFVPVIISVKPMVNLQGFLGIVNQR